MTDTRHGEKVLVLGTGNFGTCLAQHLAEQGYEVTMWARSAEAVEAINKTHKNPKYLSTITLSKRISATSNLDPETIQGASVLVMSIPTQAMRGVLQKLKGSIKPNQLIVCANKGIEVGTLKLPTQIIGEVLGKEFEDQAVCLSGPSFAVEVVARQPTAVVVASHTKERARWAQELFHAAHFRVYTSEDPLGLEVAGALKNVMAIASGAAVGIGMQANAKAALITRGLAEITRVGAAMGANPLTFKGLSGVGDLFLTCTSEKSRNFRVGFHLGKGDNLESIIKNMGSVAEGVSTAKAAKELGEKLGVATPISDQVYQVLYESKPMAQAVIELMTRDAKPELDLPIPGH